MHAVHVVLALSSVFGFGVMPFFFNDFSYWTCGMVMIASALMHSSETKHDLNPGPSLVPWSTAFLNFDRVVSVASIVFTLWNMWKYCPHNPFPWLAATWLSAGTLFLMAGEMAGDGQLMVYAVTHLVWHAAAYWAIVMADWHAVTCCV